MNDTRPKTLSSAGRRHAILTARARRLARPRQAQEAIASVSCLVCEAGGELFAIPMVRAARVAPESRPAQVPTSNRALLGVTARGGVFHQVYDLAILVGAPSTGADGHFVMLRGSPPIALRVDRALRVADLVQLAPGDASHMPPRLPVISGFARPLQNDLFDGRVISLIDPDKLASDNVPGRVEGN